MRRTIAILTAAVFLGGPYVAYSQSKETDAGTASGTLRRYIELRLRWADWKEYSQFITWPDEPGWDCFWVSKGYKIGQQTSLGRRVIIPITFSRLGQYCSGFDFVSQPKKETIRYELVQIGGAWKIDAPIPDSPYLDWQSLEKSLQRTANDERETAEVRRQAAAARNAILKSAASQMGEKIE